MKKTTSKTIRLTAFAKQSFTHRISFQEKKPNGFVERSFDTYREHLEFHLQQMKKSHGMIKGVSYKSI